ncbi:membrane bound O-acyl transferase family-domain-containing protein [Amylocystis lapponica]|nr:membrane bound O-acyl transferase family-domain-containing protein [Amylocystis lapponica]
MALTPLAVGSIATSALPLFFALVFAKSRVTRAAFFPILLACVYRTATTHHDVTIWTWSALLSALASDLLIISDAAKLRGPGQTVSPYDLPLTARCKWALSLIFSLRRIGFTHSDGPPRQVRPSPLVSRSTFVLRQAVEFAKLYIVMDIAHGCMLWMAECRADPALVSRYGSLFHRLQALAALVAARGFTGLGYIFISCVVVATGLSDARAWPPMHGKWSDAYTIRGFWGRAWHQLLRRVVSAHGEFVSSGILRLRPGTVVSNNVARFAGFYTSGLIHSFGYHGTLRHHWGDLGFYIWQAAGIGFEELVMKTVTLNPTPKMRMLGYVWTMLWFAYTLPEYTDHQFGTTVEAGCNNFRVSVVLGLWKGKWLLE